MDENARNKKEYSNNWLTDSDYIKKQVFSDSYYLESLCYTISSFLKNTPVPIVAKLSKTFEKDNLMEFSIGSIFKVLKVTTVYSYYDFITLVKQWAYPYYPSYSVDEEINVPYSHEEMLDILKNDPSVDMNDVLNMTKKETVVEKGVIEKIVLKEDKFIFNRNGKRSIYISGTIKNPMSLSSFKKSLLNITEDKAKKKFIEENSTFVQDLDKEKSIVIDYQGQQMLNFFKVNKSELLSSEVDNPAPFVWRFGRFLVKFSSQSLMDDCIRYFKNKKEELENNCD